MPIQNIPESFIAGDAPLPELFVYDYRMTGDVVKSKVNLSLHLFSFLQTGQKKVHFANTHAAVNEQQSILIKNGNCLMTELLDDELVYFCKLFFFSQQKVESFLVKHSEVLAFDTQDKVLEVPYFVIENDDYIRSFVQSLSSILYLKPAITQQLLEVKFEEIMLYLLHKYGNSFKQYLQSLVNTAAHSSFRKTVETYSCSNLKLAEIAFLCNMSLSTFKRYFINEYKVAPGKWLQQKRMHKAKELLQKGKLKSTEIYTDFGFNSLSNFSIAFKKEFGKSPSALHGKL